jgi:hypothetical protein
MGEERGTGKMAAAALAAGGTVPRAQAAALEPELRKIVGYRFGESREPLTAVQDMARSSAGSRRLELERQFAMVLGMSEATFECKDFICRQLWLMGTKESIPALSKLLESDARFGDMVRYALERNTDPLAAQALRAPLETALKTGGFPPEKSLFHLGLINSLGARKDAASITVLDRIVNGKDKDLAAAAVSAIGKIGGPRARAILAQAKGNGAPAVRRAADTALLEMSIRR